MNCILCGERVRLVFKSPKKISISSDYRLLAQPTEIYQCQQCSHYQKRCDEEYLVSVKIIFDNFKPNPLSEGSDQPKFDNGTLKTRSDVLIENVKSVFPNKGDMLDIGTGNGVFIRSFSKHFAKWNLYGFDLNDKYKNQIHGIKGVKGFYTGTLSTIGKKFDVVSCILVLQHVDSPVDFISSVKNLIKEDGFLLLQVPNLDENIFDVLIFDQKSHFTRKAIHDFCEKNFNHICIPNNQIPKETTLLLSQSDNIGFSMGHQKSFENDKVDFEYLTNIFKQIDRINKPVGVFGAATVGTCLGGLLGDKLAFFVDEDPQKWGKTYLGKKIIKPIDVNNQTKVYLPLQPEHASGIIKRLTNIEFIVPESKL